jgi:hypothetical protein
MTGVASQSLRLRSIGFLLVPALALGIPLAGCSPQPAAVSVPPQSKEELERAKLAPVAGPSRTPRPRWCSIW